MTDADRALSDSLQEEQRSKKTLKRGGRTREPRIVNPLTHPRSSVCLTVAAEFLGIDKRTLRSRIANGDLRAWRMNKTYRVEMADLLAFRARGYNQAALVK